VIGQGYMTALYYNALANASVVAALNGDAVRVRQYSERRADIYTAFNRELWDAQQGLYRDGKPFQTTVQPSKWLPADVDVETFSPHVNSLAVLYGLAPPPQAREIMTKIMSVPLVNAQPYFYFFIFDALEKAGLFDTFAVDQMHRWTINPVTGTFQEMWGRGDWSHGWGGAPAIYLSSTVLGVRPGAPGYRIVDICPTPCSLTWAKGVVPTPHGSVDVSWKLLPDGLRLQFNVPAACSAMVTLPSDDFVNGSATVDGGKPVSDISTPIALSGGSHTIVLKGTIVRK
jgi:hypothetical protein